MAGDEERPRTDGGGGGGGGTSFVIAKDVMVPMRDDVLLAADIYRPSHRGEPLPGRFPAVVARTGYDKTSDWLWVKPVAEWFVRNGYVVVLQDLRGRYRSEGFGQYFHTANPTEGPDGYDTIEWIASQVWSNGKVGMVGSSHAAIVQHVAALHRPPHLSAIWPDVGPTNIYAHEAREGGAMSMQMFGALFLHAHDAQETVATPGAQQAIAGAMQEMREWVYQTPFMPGRTPLALVPPLEQTLFDYYHRGAYDEFWSHECCDQERHFDRHADIPGVFSGGWWDPFVGGTTRYFAAMQAQNSTPQRLIVGPWTHDGMRKDFTYAGDVDFGADGVWGNAYYNDERLRWFDRWLKDEDTNVESDPPVCIFVMGGGPGRRTVDGHLSHGGRWRSEQTWPLERARSTAYYLRAGGGLSVEPPGTDDRAAEFTFDPDHPVPTLGGSIVGYYEMLPLIEGGDPWLQDQVPWRFRLRNIVPEGPMNQVEQSGMVGTRPPYGSLASRPDVLVFETEQLVEPLEVTGPVTVVLWVASDVLDTDFTAKLVDVYPPNADYPDGYQMGLCDSIIRTRFRDGWEREVLMVPGTAYEVRVELTPTSNLFAVGHRLRVDVSSSNFPRFDVNPNTGEPVGRHTHTRTACQKIYLDAEHSSRVVLPLVPVA